jgi:hypothetical protein
MPQVENKQNNNKDGGRKPMSIKSSIIGFRLSDFLAAKKRLIILPRAKTMP